MIVTPDKMDRGCGGDKGHCLNFEKSISSEPANAVNTLLITTGTATVE